MRFLLPVLAICALGACAPEVPDSGIGFNAAPGAQPFGTGDAGTIGAPIQPPMTVSDERLPSAESMAGTQPGESDPIGALEATVAAGDSSDIAAEAAAALAATSPNPAPAAITPAPATQTQTVIASAAPAVDPDHPNLSNEQNFAAVKEERSIEGDAALIERNRQQYEVIQPTALPERTGSADPNIVTYALQTSHPRGTRMYSRSGIGLASRAQRACARYPSPDKAQIDFLASGGPERDKLGLDPDGDGYACAWNPAPFRTAVKN